MNRKLNGKNVTCVIIDEPTQIKPKPIASINPMRESGWLDVFSKHLKKIKKMKPKFEIDDRVIYKPQNYIGTIYGIDRYTGIYLIQYDGDDEEYSVHENDIEFENPKTAFLTRLQELLATFDAKICSCAEGCDTSWIDVYFGEQCVIAFPINRTTECTTITAENVFDYDKD